MRPPCSAMPRYAAIPEEALVRCDGQTVNFGHRVSRSEFLWKLEQMSWLKCCLLQDGRALHASADFFVNAERFDCAYNPDGGRVSKSQNGTLALRYMGFKRIAFRYGIFVKARDETFVQWGDTRNEYHEVERGHAYGPDVHEPVRHGTPTSMGIFGLTHQQLLQSDWVANDSLTVKVLLEVRPEGDACTKVIRSAVEVPGPSLGWDMQALLEKGTCSDVLFRVQEDVIKAHSQVLCARSEVFGKQLTAGMQESVSKVIVIGDREPATFRTFLPFLYTDSFTYVEDMIETSCHGDCKRARVSQLQSLLGVSHRYQVKRLQVWCEMRLSEQVSLSDVCGMLCQAHLLQANLLEQTCLSYIKDHMAEVVTLPAYAEVMTRWTEVALKISLFVAGVPETAAAAAVDAFQNDARGKRRRLQD